MTRRLILMRHAKSSWNHPGVMDHDRPLNKRGRRSAEVMGRWLRENDLTPDEIISSTAKRTRETCEGLGFDIAATFTRRLYHAGPDEMLDILRAATGETVLIVAHNPGIAWFADTMARAPPDHPRFADYPTCATTVMTFAIDQWRAIREGTGQNTQFAIPRDLLA